MTVPAAESDNATFSFIQDSDPLIAAADTRILQLEQQLIMAERHATSTMERQLEQEEVLRNLLAHTAEAAAKAEHFQHQRQLEMHELERRLESEKTAKWKSSQQLESAAAATADLNYRLNEVTSQLAALAQPTAPLAP